jgi:hypothetical protein
MDMVRRKNSNYEYMMTGNMLMCGRDDGPYGQTPI